MPVCAEVIADQPLQRFPGNRGRQAARLFEMSVRLTHRRGMSCGSVAGYRTQLHMCPSDKIAVIVLTNADDGTPLMYVEKAFQWVAPPILKVVTPEPKAAEPDPAWQQYIGKYRRAQGDWQVLMLNGELVMLDPSLLDPIPTLNKLIPVAERTFRIETKNASGANGELVIFEMDSQGKIQQVKMGENYLYPLAEW